MDQKRRSLLVHRISKAIASHQLKQGCVHISIAKDSRWEQSSNEGDVFVRWLCWSLEDQGTEVAPPVFEVVGDECTIDVLTKELPAFFHGIDLKFDHDIRFSYIEDFQRLGKNHVPLFQGLENFSRASRRIGFRLSSS